MKLSRKVINLTIKIAISQSGIMPLLRSFLRLRRLTPSCWGDPPATASVLAPAWGLASGRCGFERFCMPVLVPHRVGAYLELGSRFLAGWWCKV